MTPAILKPAIVLVLWSLVMLGCLIRARIPELRRVGIDLKSAHGGRPGALDGVISEAAQWPAHNYIHLMEQPTLFYAIVAFIAITGNGGGYSAWLAWAYAGLRIVHSIVQATINRIYYRFLLFGAASLALFALALHAARIVFLPG